MTSRAGLGFEDCSAEVHNVSDVEFEGDNNFAVEHQVVPAKRWQFYAFNISVDDFQVVVNAAGEADSECAPHPGPTLLYCSKYLGLSDNR